MAQHKKTTVSDSIARPARTGGQIVVAATVTEFGDAFIYDMNEKQYAALLGLLILITGWAQIFIENRTGHAVLREIPEPAAPVVDANGEQQ